MQGGTRHIYQRRATPQAQRILAKILQASPVGRPARDRGRIPQPKEGEEVQLIGVSGEAVCRRGRDQP